MASVPTLCGSLSNCRMTLFLFALPKWGTSRTSFAQCRWFTRLACWWCVLQYRFGGDSRVGYRHRSTPRSHDVLVVHSHPASIHGFAMRATERLVFRMLQDKIRGGRGDGRMPPLSQRPSRIIRSRKFKDTAPSGNLFPPTLERLHLR